VFGSGIRRLDGAAVAGRRLARTPPRRVTHWLGDIDNRTTGSSTLFSRFQARTIEFKPSASADELESPNDRSNAVSAVS
jgi:hypothetical protein